MKISLPPLRYRHNASRKKIHQFRLLCAWAGKPLVNHSSRYRCELIAAQMILMGNYRQIHWKKNGLLLQKTCDAFSGLEFNDKENRMAANSLTSLASVPLERPITHATRISLRNRSGILPVGSGARWAMQCKTQWNWSYFHILFN